MPAERIENVRKTIALIKEMLQFAFIVLLAIIAVTAVAKPSWARQELARLGIRVSDISIAGVKLAVGQSISVSDAVSEAQARLNDAQARLKSSSASPEAAAAIAEATNSLAVVRVKLNEEEKKIKQLQRDAGLRPDIPASAWITVGVLSDASGLFPAARIDKDRTAISARRVKSVTLKQDAIVRTEDECAPAIEVSNVPPVTEAQMQTLVILLKAGEYQAVETQLCPTRIKGMSTMSARISLSDSSVRLAQFQAARGQ
jgi:hypothetical protein